MKITLNKHNDLFQKSISEIEKEKIIERIWQKDYTVWNNDPKEISNRLGWLDCFEVTPKSFDEIKVFVGQVRQDGFTNALLLGMGGSSLAPEVFRFTFGGKGGFLDLHVSDSTHPEAVLECTRKLDPAKTLYIVSTKSGGTIETISFMKYFYTFAARKLGKEKAANHFIAITDPGSGLEAIAKELNFRKIFLNDPDIGGRFSALSLFGIVPAALIGLDIEKLLLKTSEIIEGCKKTNLEQNEAAKLGAVIGTLAKVGIDKLTLIISPQLKYLGGWLEQLVAESTGKNGKGVLPVDLESFESTENYSGDRFFVYIKLKSDLFFNEGIDKIKDAGFSVIEIELEDLYELGGEFFKWEFATAVTGYVLGVQPFDQPNVESAKVAGREMMKEYQQKGKLPELTSALEEKGIEVYGDIKEKNLNDALNSFLSQSVSGKSYVAIQAYLKPEEKTWELLQMFRSKIMNKYKVATTLGYGPRFLHSTGQLHKGDGGNGLFIQFIANDLEDSAIPDKAGEVKSSITFGILKNAQALGDRQALLDNNRRVITIDLGKEVEKSLKYLTHTLK